MNGRFRFISYLLLIFMTAIFCNCNSLPSETETPVTDQTFNPVSLAWEEISLPAKLVGNWYADGKLELFINGDTVYTQNGRSTFYSTAKSGSYIMLIHNIEYMYRVTYINNLSDSTLEITYSDSSTSNPAEVVNLPLRGGWKTLTSTNPWISTQMPGGLTGNWHVQDGVLELAIDNDKVEIDGTAWNIDSVQTNKTAERLLLSSGSNYKTFYYQEVGSRWMSVRIVDGKLDLQDRYGRVQGNFTGVFKWWDIFESGGLKQGAKWVYDFSYEQIHEVDSTSTSPKVSIDSTLNSSGKLEVEVTNSTIADGSGTLSLLVTFTTNVEQGRYLHTLSTLPVQVLTDTAWADSSLNRIISNQYDLTLEDDTLWYDLPGGKQFFASSKISLSVSVNAEMFLYPLIPAWPEPIDWDDRSGAVTIFEDIVREDFNYRSGSFYVYGGGTRIRFAPGMGFDVILYDFPDIATGLPTPHEIRNILECRLESFSPGQ